MFFLGNSTELFMDGPQVYTGKATHHTHCIGTNSVGTSKLMYLQMQQIPDRGHQCGPKFQETLREHLHIPYSGSILGTHPETSYGTMSRQQSEKIGILKQYSRHP